MNTTIGAMSEKMPEKDVWIGDYGMQLFEKAGDLCVSARFRRDSGNIDHFLLQLRSAILLWCSQHPRPGAQQPAIRTERSTGLRTKVRLPETSEELKELESLAQKGPNEVYKWVYGDKSLMARAMQDVTWAQFGIQDPSEGCQRLLEAIRSHDQDLRLVRPQLRKKP
jgi:hypothetical protein